MSTITVTPIAGSLGAVVRGVDLRTMDNQAWRSSTRRSSTTR
jgi:hypothetical protein